MWQGGLAGCGLTIAHRIVLTGLGRKLVAAAAGRSDTEIKQFLVGWRKELREHLLHDQDGILGRRYSTLAHRVNESFPRLDVLRKYIEPVTSSSRGLELDHKSWVPRRPDLGALANLCTTLFAWTCLEGDMQTKFKNLVWPGAIFRSMLQVI